MSSMDFTFMERWNGVAFYVGEIQQCMKQPKMTTDTCMEKLLGEKRWTNPANQRKKDNVRAVIEDKYMHLFSTTEMPEKYPTFADPAVGGMTNPANQRKKDNVRAVIED